MEDVEHGGHLEGEQAGTILGRFGVIGDDEPGSARVRLQDMPWWQSDMMNARCCWSAVFEARHEHTGRDDVAKVPSWLPSMRKGREGMEWMVEG